ncbi:hypothetical protein PZH41_25990, partial [Phocaeicola vulgatus]|nr:hypothetical protein [Phocaeicola vulgatus]
RFHGASRLVKVRILAHAIEAADGLYEWLRKKVDGFIDINNGKTVYQIKPFVLGEITEANIGEKLFQGHSFASLVTLEEGVPIETISKMLGHSNIK